MYIRYFIIYNVLYLYIVFISNNLCVVSVTFSDKVGSTKDELEHQQQIIVQSGKLLGKYGRREVTDKVLIALALIFFLVVVAYILQKRLF